MSWVLIMVLYSYSAGDPTPSIANWRPSTMSTDTTVIEFQDEQSCQIARSGVMSGFSLQKQDRLDTNVRVDAACFKRTQK